MDKQNLIKQRVAEAAVDFLQDNLQQAAIIGVGTGSTANYFISALVKIKHLISGAVASSEASADRLRLVGIPLIDLNSIDKLEYYIDGADEINPQLEMVKGGGGALMREKIVAAVSDKFICIADASKMVQTLGKFPLPIEVIPMAESYVQRELVARYAGEARSRSGFISDNGNIIIDVHGWQINAATTLENQLNQIVGVVCNGLFANRKADVLLLGKSDGVEKICR